MSTDREKYFANKYRIPSARLQNWDYRNNAAYFVTICTQNRDHYFGEIMESDDIVDPLNMQLSEIGELANKYWNEIPKHFPFVKLGAFVVMPNHIHGIIIIDNYVDTDDNDENDAGRDVACNVSTSVANAIAIRIKMENTKITA